MTLSVPYSVQNIKTIWQLSDSLWTNVISYDLSLRRVSDAVDFILHLTTGESVTKWWSKNFQVSVVSRGYALFRVEQNKCDSLQWRHNGRDSVSNHQHHDCLLNLLFRRRSKKTSKLRVTGFCAGSSPGTGEFSAQMASYAENVSIWWRHHIKLTREATSRESPNPQFRTINFIIIQWVCPQNMFLCGLVSIYLPISFRIIYVHSIWY